MDNEIQIYGRLGIPADDATQNTPTEPAAPAEEMTAGQLVPRYTVEQRVYPRTGENNQAFFFSLLGIFLVILVVWLNRENRKEQNQG